MPRIERKKGFKPFWTFIVTISLLVLVIFWGPFLGILIISSWIYLFYIGLLFYFLINRKLEVENHILILKNRKGKIISQIDLNKDYEVDYIFKGYEWAIYKVKQDSNVLRFTRRSEGVDNLVKKYFKMEWPPVGMYPGI
ncbi:MAG: hypothetical protein GWO07_11690 [Candidatus Dadabacteria bacterium]|nr:hypothetical protein [Candidatus Dadabacteria bacterium]NIS09400.1 hypothetical protein [Candidatus Dadabacteria bacterium]NIV42537.1 hypothetical protein [Candidatus Dadabacteria bacterium]NIY22638.1 hypothetical protein [Candidatus Dadabacteria bacterium]